MCPTEGKYILLEMYSLVGYMIIFKLVFNFIISNYLAHPFKSCKMLRNTGICSETSTTQPDYNHTFAALFCFDCRVKV